MDNWIMYTFIWLLVGFVILITRLRYDDNFGGWMLMLSDSRHGTAGHCVAIAVILVAFCPIHLLIRRR